LKIKACPSIDTVRCILQERITAEKEYLVGKRSALDSLNTGTSSPYKPGEETEKRILREHISLSEGYLRSRETEMILLQSHTAPRVLVEIEV